MLHCICMYVDVMVCVCQTSVVNISGTLSDSLRLT